MREKREYGCCPKELCVILSPHSPPGLRPYRCWVAPATLGLFQVTVVCVCLCACVCLLLNPLSNSQKCKQTWEKSEERGGGLC